MCRKMTSAIDTASRSALRPRARESVASGHCCGRRKTSSAPSVRPNMAMEIAMKAKWNHMVSEKMRVSSTSNMTVESATRNNASSKPLRLGAITRAERPLHEDAVDPAAELEAHRAQGADAQETARRVHADGGGVGAVADHRDHLTIAEGFALPHQLFEQPL